MKQENKTKSIKKFSVKMLLTTWPKLIQSILAPGMLVVGVMYLIRVVKYSCSCVSLQKDRILR